MSNQRLSVLVVGATGSIGRLVVEEALAKGHAVRAPARDPGKARRLLPGAEVVVGDLTRPDTLNAARPELKILVKGNLASLLRFAQMRNAPTRPKWTNWSVRNRWLRGPDTNDTVRWFGWPRDGCRLVHHASSPWTIFDPGSSMRRERACCHA